MSDKKDPCDEQLSNFANASSGRTVATDSNGKEFFFLFSFGLFLFFFLKRYSSRFSH